MGFEVRVNGGDLAAVRRALRDMGDKGLGRQLSKGLQAAAKPLAKEVRAEASKVMPSGYAPTLSKSLRFRQSIQERRDSARLTYRVYGDGTREKRDVPALNKGTLRHPVFGRSRRIRVGNRAGTAIPNPWVAQRVRKGFVDRPVDRLAPEVRRQMDAVVDAIADQITGRG